MVLLCVASVGNVYPISRSDYDSKDQYYTTEGIPYATYSNFFDDRNRNGMALMPGFDAHWFTIHQPVLNDVTDCQCYVPDKFPPSYDEVVVKEEKQFLPIAIVRLKERKSNRENVQVLNH